MLGTPDAELSRSELRAKTGCVAAVRDVSFDVWPGEVFVVMGLSGSGKSTLVRTLIRLIEPTAGSIEIAGQDVMQAIAQQLRELRRHSVSMVFQHFGLLAHRRVIDNVAFGLEIRGVAKAERLAKARETLRLVGLEDVENSFPDQLSGGMQQRVGVARAFARQPGGDALRRAVQRSRPSHPPRHAGRGDPSAEGDREDDGLHHARPPRGAPARARGSRSCETAPSCSSAHREELVGSPADDYVENFVRDVPRSHVLTLRWIMRPPEPGEETDGPMLDVTTTVRDAVPVLAATEKPVRATRDGHVVGVVDRVAVLSAIAGEGG